MTTSTTSTTATSYNLEQNVFSGVPSLVSTAMGPARHWFSGALEWVCGEPDTLRATGQRYAELGTKVQQLAQQLGSDQALVPTWTGPGHDAFATTTTKAVDVLNAVGEYTAYTQEILNAAAQVAVEAANMIWDLVTELVQWLVMTLIKALAASTISMGSSIAAWLGSAIGQVARVVAKVAQICGKVGQLLMKIVQLLTKITALIAKYQELLTEIEKILRKVKELYTKSAGLRDAMGKLPDGVSWQQYRDATPEQRAALFAGSANTLGIGGSYDPSSLGTATATAYDPGAYSPATGTPYSPSTYDPSTYDPSTYDPGGNDTAATPTSGTVAAGVGTGTGSGTGSMPTPTTGAYAPGGSMSTPPLPTGGYSGGYSASGGSSGGSSGAGVRSVSQLPPLTRASTGPTLSVPPSTISREQGATAMPPIATPMPSSRVSGPGVASETRDEWNESDAEAAAAQAMDSFGSGTVAAGVAGPANGAGAVGGIGAGLPGGGSAPTMDLPGRGSPAMGGTVSGGSLAASAPAAPTARPTGSSSVGVGGPMGMPLGAPGRNDRKNDADGPTLTETGWELEQSLDETEEVATGVIGA